MIYEPEIHLTTMEPYQVFTCFPPICLIPPTSPLIVKTLVLPGTSPQPYIKNVLGKSPRVVILAQESNPPVWWQLASTDGPVSACGPWHVR